MRFSDSLIEQIREAKKSITLDIKSRSAVIENLKFLYDACAASEQLLIDAYDACAIRQLRRYYSKHLVEESGEIEILQNDLKSIVLFPKAPGAAAMAMTGSQYYMIKHVDPVCLLGYMAIMEGDPTPIAVIEQLEQIHGKSMFGFCRLHAIKDIEHAKELKDVIDSVPDDKKSLITFSANNALGYLAQASKEWSSYG